MVLELIGLPGINDLNKWNKQLGVLFDDDAFERWQNMCGYNGFGVLNSFLNGLQLKALKPCNWILFVFLVFSLFCFWIF